MLANPSPGYKEKFAIEYMKYTSRSMHGRHIYDDQFPNLLVRAYAYMQRSGLSFDKPTPKAGSIPPITPAPKPL